MSESLITFGLLDDKLHELDNMEKRVNQLHNAKVVFRARNQVEILAALSRSSALPDFILVDIKIGDDFKEGYRIAKELHQKYPDISIILTSEYPDTSYIKDVMANGTAMGFINKENLAYGLPKAVKKIIAGEEYWQEVPKDSYMKNTGYLDRDCEKRLKEEIYYLMSPSEKTALKAAGKKRADIKTSPKDVKAYFPDYMRQRNNGLSVHKWLVFKFIALGKSTTEIAEILQSTPDSINTQKGEIKDRMQLGGSGDIWFLVKALEMGIVEVRSFLEKEAGVVIMD